MKDEEIRNHLLYIYERLRDQQEFIADLTVLVTPLLASLSDACPGFGEAYRRRANVMQPKVIRAKLDSLEQLEARIQMLKAEQS